MQGTKGVDIGTDLSEARDSPVDIYVRVAFLKIGEINTVAETYTADVFVQSRWRESSLDDERGVDGELPKGMAVWDPKLYIENALNTKEDVWYTIQYKEGGQAFIYQKRRAKATFYERMELKEFPFDTQDLAVTVTSERGEKELKIQQDLLEPSSVNSESFVEQQEWKLRRRIIALSRVTTNAYKNSKHKFPALSLSAAVTRRSNFYLWNVIIIMVFISSLSFATFTVNQSKVENRLQLTFILLLSNITFKFTINQSLPRVSYLTLMDKYIIGSMFQLCLVCVWHAVVSRLTDDTEEAKLADYIAVGILTFGYIVFNIAFVIASRVIKRRGWSYNEKKAREMGPPVEDDGAFYKKWSSSIVPAVSTTQKVYDA